MLPTVQSFVYLLPTFKPVSFQDASPDLYQVAFPSVVHFFQVIPVFPDTPFQACE